MTQPSRFDEMFGGSGPHLVLPRVTGEGPLPPVPLLPPETASPHVHRWVRHAELPDGSAWYSVGVVPQGHLVRFYGMADFVLDPDGRCLSCRPEPRLPRQTLCHLLLDQVLPLALSRRGRVVVHAGAVLIGGEAVAFLGETGRGKSTLVSSFGLDGAPLLSDDSIIVSEDGGALSVVATYPSLRLWRDSVETLFGADTALPQVAHYTGKRRLSPADTGMTWHEGPVRLRGAYLLAPPGQTADADGITIAPVSLRDTAMELMKGTFHLLVDDRDLLRREFERIVRWSRMVPLFRLSYPRHYSLLQDVRTAILAHVGPPQTSRTPGTEPDSAAAPVESECA
ncbi:MAG: hypothetical protein GXY85_03555 [Candidatus Brocadiaceae bacterium]|nr:hypothetical protein [Candidatus Brocadiaceae bacterium]